MIQYAKLAMEVPIVLLQNEVKKLLSETWIPHFNRVHYQGNWDVISLFSPGGKSDIAFPELMGEKKYARTTILEGMPEMQHFLKKFECEVGSVRLLRLSSGAVIKPHKDHQLAFEKGEARLHVPIFTNEQVAFVLAGERIQMRSGECWYINANLTHQVSNLGPTDRIHLVIDCKVNKWLSLLFDCSEVKQKKESKDPEMLKQMIALLEEHHHQASIQLIKTLKQELSNE